MDKAFAEGYIPYGRRVSLSSAKRDRWSLIFELGCSQM